MTFHQSVMKVADPVYAQTTRVKKEIEAAEQRQVTYSEVIERLVKLYDQTAALVADVKAS